MNKYCFINGCKSSSKLNPNKLFITVPKPEKRRKVWLDIAGKTNLSESRTFFCCEDHFDLQEDILNYKEFKIRGGQMKHKENLVPHKNIVTNDCGCLSSTSKTLSTKDVYIQATPLMCSKSVQVKVKVSDRESQNLNLCSASIGNFSSGVKNNGNIVMTVQNQTIGINTKKVLSTQTNQILNSKNINEIVGNVQTQVKQPFNQTSSAQSQEICRLCLINNRNIRSIFNNNHINWVENDLSRQIFECANIKVSENDGATGICKVCLQEIISIIRFRKKCLESDLYLKSINNCSEESTNLLKLKEDNFITFINLGTEEKIITKQKSISEQSRVEINDADDHDLLIETIPSTAQNIIQSDQSTNYEIESESSSEDFGDKNDYKDSDFTTPSENSSDEEVILNKKEKLKEEKLKRKLRLFELSKDIEIDLGLEPENLTRGLCYICGLFTNYLTDHMLSHTTLRTEKCDICERTFITPNTLKIHRLTHNKKKTKCEKCDKKFQSTYHMKRHSRSVHRAYNIKCNICSKSFKKKYHLQVHSRMHTGEKRFNCKLCNKFYTHSYSLKEHNTKFHPESTT